MYVKFVKISICIVELEDFYYKVINGVICYFLINVIFLYKLVLYVILLIF